MVLLIVERGGMLVNEKVEAGNATNDGGIFRVLHWLAF
jgi:hypothetical protein